MQTSHVGAIQMPTQPVADAYYIVKGYVSVLFVNYTCCCVKDSSTCQREFETFIRAVYYLLNSIARQTSLEIREFTLPGPGPC